MPASPKSAINEVQAPAAVVQAEWIRELWVSGEVVFVGFALKVRVEEW